MRESSHGLKRQLKTYQSTGRNARQKSISKYSSFLFSESNLFLERKHLPVNPLDKNKYSSARNLSKEQKKRRIAGFIENLPHKMINKMRNIETLQEEIQEDIDYDCPFAPALCNKSRDIVNRRSLKKIQNRYQDEYREKQRKLN